jgi:predicted DNA repair protein MutK
MPASSLLALIDDIATLLDDVATLSKVAAKQTAGVLGDDLALNAQQVSGVSADRELPVVWAVARGSLVNKAILVPAAVALSAFAPMLVTPLLMAGGAYLCFEGFEKLAHPWLHAPAVPAPAAAATPGATLAALPPADLAALEKIRVRGAIRTDFILSAEIIAITLGTVATEPLSTQFLVLAGVAVLMTVGVYGLVAGIVKIDDLGLWLSRRPGVLAKKVGVALVGAAPWLMKGLSVAGTAAMFLVGGGILVHGVPALHHAITELLPQGMPWLGMLVPALLNAGVGVLAGAAVLAVVHAVARVAQRLRG